MHNELSQNLPLNYEVYDNRSVVNAVVVVHLTYPLATMAYWVLSNEISFIWTNILLYHSINQWYVHMSNLQTLFGARLN